MLLLVYNNVKGVCKMNNSLGEYVKKRRQDMGMSLREFASLCKISHTHIDSIEKGYDVRSGREVNPTSATLKKLAAALGVSEKELVSINLGRESAAPSGDEALKFALFGDGNISDEMLDEVKKFAQFIKSREDNRA